MTVHLTRASAPLTERVLAVDELGQAVEVSIPAERALTRPRWPGERAARIRAAAAATLRDMGGGL